MFRFHCVWVSIIWVSFAFLGAGEAWSKDLTVERLIVHQIEDGPAADASIDFLPGETVYLSFRVSGFEAKAKDDEFRTVSLRYTIEISDPEGTAAVPKIAAGVSTEIREQDKDWAPRVRREFVLPDFAMRGKYKIALWLKDETSGEETRAEALLTVRNRDVPPSSELAAKNFGFFRTENDRRALAEPVFRTGDPVIVRFDITGYKLGPKNLVDVDYGLEVVGPDDKKVIDQPNAAKEKSEAFYPRRWVPVSMRLDLPANPASGQYALLIRIRDVVADKELEVRQSFRVE